MFQHFYSHGLRSILEGDSAGAQAYFKSNLKKCKILLLLPRASKTITGTPAVDKNDEKKLQCIVARCHCQCYSLDIPRAKLISSTIYAVY